jgi:hypothetical protein
MQCRLMANHIHIVFSIESSFRMAGFLLHYTKNYGKESARRYTAFARRQGGIGIVQYLCK